MAFVKIIRSLAHKPMMTTCTSKPGEVRTLFGWLNIVFNNVDQQRIKEVGPNQACAEWLIRNGAFVRWQGDSKMTTDYNTLQYTGSRQIQEVHADDASIMHYGFPNFIGCQHIQKIVFHQCKLLENQALAHLAVLNGSLVYLEIKSCFNISEEGLKELAALTKLKELHLENLPYVEDKESISNFLKTALPECKIDII